MIDWLKNVAVRMAGLGKAVDALDGQDSKTYAAGAEKILTGAAAVLAGLAGIAGQLVAAHGSADYWALAQGLLHNVSVGTITGGWALILSGKADIAQRHATAKLAEAAKVVPTVPAVVPAAVEPGTGSKPA